MTNPVVLKRSAVPGKVPVIGDLSLGEVAVNTYDGRIFTKKNNGVESLVEFATTDALNGKFDKSGGNVSGATAFDSEVTVSGRLHIAYPIHSIGLTVSGRDGIEDDLKDRGFDFLYAENAVEKKGFFGFDRATSKFKYLLNTTNTNNIISGDKGTMDAYLEWNNLLSKPVSDAELGYLSGVTSNVQTQLTTLDGRVDSLEAGGGGQPLADVAYTGSYADLTNKPALFSGSYVDLTNKPTIPANTSQISESGNLYFTNARAIAAPLAGFSTGTATAVVAADTIVAGMGKLQAQMNGKQASLGYTPANKAGDTFSGPMVFNNKVTLEEVRYKNSYRQEFRQSYTPSSYLTVGEFQELLTVTPNGSSQNYDLIGQIVIQGGNIVQVINFNLVLRSDVLPQLSWTCQYEEDAPGGVIFVKPVLWVKETTTAEFKLALQGLTSSVHNIDFKVEVVNRASSYDNVVVNTVGSNSDVATVPAGFTQYEFIRVRSSDNGVVAYTYGLTAPSFTGDLVGNAASANSVPWAGVSGKPAFATVATSGSYADLANKPALFDGAYASLSGLPTLFSGSYADLTNKPTIPANTSQIAESGNLYFTNARAIAAPLTGLSTATATSVAAADSILVGMGKLQAQVNGKQANLGFTPYNAANPAGYITSAGTARSAPRLDTIAQYTKTNAHLPLDWELGMTTTFVQPSDGWFGYGTVTTTRTYSQGGGTMQMYTPYSEANGGKSLRVRFGDYAQASGNAWTPWKVLLADDNFNSYAPTLTGGGASGSWAINAATATKLATARTINGKPFDGTANVTLLTTDVAEGTNLYYTDARAQAAMASAMNLKADLTYVDQKVADLVASSPAALDTLNELAASLGNDANFATTMSTSLGNRLRVDTAVQGLDATQKSNAKTNLGLHAVATSGSSSDMVEGTKLFHTSARVLAVALAGLSTTTNAAITAADTVLSGMGKLQKQITDALTAISGKEASINTGTTAQFWRGDKTWQDIATNVRASVMTGLSTASSTAVVAADSLIVAIGKLQAQINGKQAALGFTPYNATNPAGYITLAEVPADAVSSVAGKTGDVTLVKGDVGLGNVDNTADADKPVSTAQQTALDAKASLTGVESLTNKTLVNPLLTGARETKIALAANNIDTATGTLFTKTIAGATTLTLSNVPVTGNVCSFILELTNAGSAVITWWAGIKWASGTAPTLTAAGRDVLGFYSHDGGTTWNGLVLAKDIK